MRQILLTSLLLFYITNTSSHPCGGYSCGQSTGCAQCTDSRSSCCTGSSSCCTSRSSSCCTDKSSSCCTGRSSSCCTGQSSSCCTGRSTTCCTGGSSTCCTGESSSCCTGGRPDGSPCCSNECTPICTNDRCDNVRCPPSYPIPPSVTTPMTYPPYSNERITPAPPSGRSYPSNSTSINNNNNTITIPTNITIQNEVRTETRISIPVSVSVNTVNNINIREESNTSSRGVQPPLPPSPVPPPVYPPSPPSIIPTDTKNVTVFVPVPVYIPIPVPYYVTIPKIVQVPVGCCQVATPCMPYTYGGCHKSTLQCNQECTDSHVYQSRDVCGHGCYKRDFAMGSRCSYDGCQRSQVDCSMCNQNFYSSYDTFLECGGCYVPMPWGMGGG